MLNRSIKAILAVLLTNPLFAQANREPNVSVGIGRYTYIQTTNFNRLFAKSTISYPSITVDLPISNRLSFNTKLFYLFNSNLIRYGYSLGDWGYEKVLLNEYLILPRLQYIFLNSGSFTMCIRLGMFTGHIFEYSELPYSSEYKHLDIKYEKQFYLFGVSAGFGIQERIPNYPLSIFLNFDTHYADTKYQSRLLREYAGFLIDVGIGLDI